MRAFISPDAGIPGAGVQVTRAGVRENMLQIECILKGCVENKKMFKIYIIG